MHFKYFLHYKSTTNLHVLHFIFFHAFFLLKLALLIENFDLFLNGSLLLVLLLQIAQVLRLQFFDIAMKSSAKNNQNKAMSAERKNKKRETLYMVRYLSAFFFSSSKIRATVLLLIWSIMQRAPSILWAALHDSTWTKVFWRSICSEWRFRCFFKRPKTWQQNHRNGSVHSVQTTKNRQWMARCHSIANLFSFLDSIESMDLTDDV